MAELGIIASVVQIADVGLRLSIKLYTFGEIVASADRSVISISKDVSLTSGVLKELGQILDKDKETRTFSENAVHTADGVVKECLEVFQEMENILVKKMPSLATGDGRDGKGGERTKRAMVILERLKWGYLQPKLELLRSNLDRLKSTLLLMLNVITYARQVSGKIESPSVIAEQRSLIEDLAHSNQEYIRKFEELKLGIDGTAVEQVDDASNIGGGAIERESATTTRSLLEAPTRESMGMNFAGEGISLQGKENTRVLGSRELTTATRSLPKAQRSETRSLANPPNANTGNVFINTSARTNIVMPPVQERGIPTTEAPTELEQEVLFKQLEHYSMLINNLLKEVDEAQYKITFKSRLRVKGGIAGLHEKERQELERIWGGTALQSAEQRLESLVDGLGELPRRNTFAGENPVPMSSPVIMRRTEKLPSMAPNREPDTRKQEEPVVWLPQATPDESLFSLDSVTRASPIEDLPQMPILVNEAAAKESRIIDVSESTKSPTERMVKAYTRNDSVPGSGFVPIAEANTKLADEGTKKQDSMRVRTLRRKKGLALSAAPEAAPAHSVGDIQLSEIPGRDVEGTIYPAIRRTSRQTGLSQTASHKNRMRHGRSRASSQSSRQLSSVPPTVARIPVAPSPSPGKPISPHTPHTNAVPSRLSANSTIEYAHRVPGWAEDGRERPTATDGAQDARSDRDSSPGAIDIPYSPRLFRHKYRSSSSAAQQARNNYIGDDELLPFKIRSASLGVDDRSPVSGGAVADMYGNNVSENPDDSRFSSLRPSSEFENEEPLLFARSQIDATQQPHRNLEEHRAGERGGSDLGAGAFGYVPIMPATSVNDSPYMAHSTEISQLVKESSFTDGPDRWRFLFDPNVEETNTDIVSHSADPSLSSTYVAPDVSRNDYQNDLPVAQSFQAFLRRRHSYNPQPAIIIEDPNDIVAVKRARNTIAARKSRAKRTQRTERLVSQVTKLEAEAEHRKSIALSFEQRHEDSEVGDTESRQKGEGTGKRRAAVVNNFSAHGGNTALLLEDAPTQHRAPAAPITSHAPFSFGGQSPQGVPQFYGPTKNELTQEKLVLPATKKRKGNNIASPLTPAQAPSPAAPSKFSPFGKTESPEPTALPVTGSSLGPSAGERYRTAMRNSARRDKLALQQQDTVKPGSNGLDEVANESYQMPFNSDLNNSDILENFDFEKFLQTTNGDFNFDPSTFEKADVIENAKSYGSFAGLEGCVVAKCGTVEDKDGNTVGAITDGNAGNADRLLGHAVDEDGNIVDEHGSIIGHAKLYEEAEEEEEEEVKADLSILKGLTVDKQGNVIGPEGVPIARLVEGNAKELAGKKCDEEGQLWNDSDKVIGRCELISDNEREAKPEGPFAGIEGCVGVKDGFVEDEDNNRVGVVVEGDAKRLIGRVVDEDDDIIDKDGNVEGHAEPYEEPKEEIADLSYLEGKTVISLGMLLMKVAWSREILRK